MKSSANWKSLVLLYVQGLKPEAVSEIVQALEYADRMGEPSCVWHEVHAWHRRNVERPRCALCGGTGGLDPDGAHFLCRVRDSIGQPTPSLGDGYPCPCYKCTHARESQ